VITDVITKVDKFIYDLENGNIEISPKAETMSILESYKGRLGQNVKKVKGSFLNELGHAISDYKLETYPRLRWEFAQQCLRYVEWSYTHGLVIEKGLDRKLKSLEEENKQLKELTVTAISKTEDAHQLLYSLENQLRQFVSIKTQENSGRIDESILRDWESTKRREAQPQRKPLDCDLIYFSTFDQLKKIIVQNENWDKIFKRYFRRQDGVISRINELVDIRDNIAHNRMLSEFDYSCFKTLYGEIMNCIETKSESKASK